MRWLTRLQSKESVSDEGFGVVRPGSSGFDLAQVATGIKRKVPEAESESDSSEGPPKRGRKGRLSARKRKALKAKPSPKAKARPAPKVAGVGKKGLHRATAGGQGELLQLCPRQGVPRPMQAQARARVREVPAESSDNGMQGRLGRWRAPGGRERRGDAASPW